MSVRTNFRAGLRLGALVAVSFVFVLSIATTATMGYFVPDPLGVVWLAVSAFLALGLGFPAVIAWGYRT